MKTSICIIAVCMVIRVIQNAIQLHLLLSEKAQRINAYSEFVKSLKMSDRQFVERLLKEFEQGEQ